jgi:hypothetical protein
LTSLSVTGNISGGNLITAGNVYAPAIVNNGAFNTDIQLGSASGIIAVTTNGNSTQFKPSGQIELGGVSQVVGGTFGGSGITLGINQTDIFQNRDGNVTIQVGTGGATTSTWTFTNSGNLLAPGNISGNYLFGNGAFITGLPAGYSNVDTRNYLANSGNIQINWTNGGVLIQGSNTANSKTGFATVTSNSTSATTLVSIDAETNDAVQFLIKGQDTVSGAYQVSKVHSLTDGLTTLDYATFGDVALLGGCGTIQVSLSSGNVVLQVTPKSANAMTWTATYTSI